MKIKFKIKRMADYGYIEEVFIIKDSFLAYFNGMHEQYLFDILTGQKVENEEKEEEALKAVRNFLYGKEANK